MPRETFAIPPNGKSVVRCENFPECMCGEDCTRTDPESPAVRPILFGLMIAVALIGAGLVVAGLR